jgi:hypothetical protein
VQRFFRPALVVLAFFPERVVADAVSFPCRRSAGEYSRTSADAGLFRVGGLICRAVIVGLSITL